jgi:hypothetical protein
MFYEHFWKTQAGRNYLDVLEAYSASTELLSVKVDVIHPEVFIRVLRIKRVGQTQLCGIRNTTILHLKGYMFRL